MHPILFQIGNFPVRSYGVLLMIGVAIAAFWAAKRTEKFGLKPEVVWDGLLWMIIPGILGARGVYMATHWDEFAGRPDRIFSIQFNGLTSFGGVIFSIIGLLIYVRIKKIPVWPMLDMIAVPCLVAHAIGRVGCLLNGCCFGYPCTGGICVHVEGHSGTFLPAQGLDTLLCLVIAGVLLLIERKQLKPGVGFMLGVIGYAVSRFVFEFWRAGPFDQATGTYLPDLLGSTPLTKAQWMSTLLIVVSIVVVILRLRASSSDDSSGGPTQA